jgi:hypothetical protein
MIIRMLMVGENHHGRPCRLIIKPLRGLFIFGGSPQVSGSRKQPTGNPALLRRCYNFPGLASGPDPAALIRGAFET